jgi:hypothetical protein
LDFVKMNKLNYMYKKNALKYQVQGFPSNATVSIVVYYSIQSICYMFRSYDHLKMVLRPKHVADNLNKIVNNYWYRVALDRNPWTWSKTLNRMQTPKFKHWDIFSKTSELSLCHIKK